MDNYISEYRKNKNFKFECAFKKHEYLDELEIAANEFCNVYNKKLNNVDVYENMLKVNEDDNVVVNALLERTKADISILEQKSSIIELLQAYSLSAHIKMNACNNVLASRKPEVLLNKNLGVSVDVLFFKYKMMLEEMFNPVCNDRKCVRVTFQMEDGNLVCEIV